MKPIHKFTYLVTGGAGFIGSHLVESLLPIAEAVHVIDNLSTGTFNNIEPFMKINHFKFFESDICDRTSLDQAMANVDFVFHQAAVPSVQRSIDDPLESHLSNALGTLHVLESAKKCNVKRLIYASSSSIYGNAGTLPLREDMKAMPMSPYALAKFSGERYSQLYYQLFGLETVCLRYFNVFGPRQRTDSIYSAVIPNIATRMKQGKQPIVFGDGTQSRDFTFVENVVQANLLACHAPNVAGEVFNVSGGRSYSLLELIETLNSLMGTNISSIHKDKRHGEVNHSLADISKACEYLDYKPRVSFEAGLKNYLSNLR